MGFKRRTFLQQAGLVLFALGAGEIGQGLVGGKSLAVPLLERYYQALAQPQGRKLALLVGINQYPRSVTPLQGCVTDVELQRELLIHRFGFAPEDVLVLTNSAATRSQIEQAFLEHLGQQASAEDVVLFHFSGYGSRIQSFPLGQPAQSNGLIPYDGKLGESLEVNALPEETLRLLVRSLPTSQVTIVLDTSYQTVKQPLQGSLRVRSHPFITGQPLSAEALQFQAQLREQLAQTLSPRQLAASKSGVILAAAGPDQLAAETAWGGFNAGLFTYALTQHLWQAIAPTTVQISLHSTTSLLRRVAGTQQQPQLITPNPNLLPTAAYYVALDADTSADGVVIAVEETGKTGHLWLGGLPAPVWESYGLNSLFTLSATEGEATPPGQLILRSKEGLTARARWVGQEVPETLKLQVGQRVQEAVRVLPRNLGLTLALDSNLERIDRVDASSAFAGVGEVSSVVNAGEQPADYLFGKVKEPKSATASATSPTEGGYGLFSLGRDLLFKSAGDAGEAVKAAANRLTPHLQTLLATKLWRLTLNEGSSRLPVRGSLELSSSQGSTVIQRATSRGRDRTSKLSINSQGLAQALPVVAGGSRLQCRLENLSDQEIYFLILGINSTGHPIILYPPFATATPETPDTPPQLVPGVLPPKESLVFPPAEALEPWRVSTPPGLMEVQFICSRAPFQQTLSVLAASLPYPGNGITELRNPLAIARAVLQDLHQASAVPPESVGNPGDMYLLDVNAWATLNFVYQVS